MNKETEIKLDLTMEAAKIFEASPMLATRPRSSNLRSIYFDTPSHLLSDCGLSLRIRLANRSRIQTIKTASAKAAGLFVRTEWEQSVDDDRPMLDETTPLTRLLGDKVRDIGPIFEVHVKRQIWIVQEGDTVIEIALDRGEVIAGDRREPICEIELELKSGAASVLFAWVHNINAIVPVHIGVLSKAERGYRLQGALANSSKAAAILLQKDTTVQAAFQHIAGATLRQFRLNEGQISRYNPDALHQARVSLRRLRSLMTIFKPILLDDDFSVIRDDLRWLVGELGRARDLDVVTKAITTEPLLGRLEAARAAAYYSVAETLGSERARALMINLAEWISAGPWLSQIETENERNRTSKDFARNALRRLRNKVKNAADLTSLDDDQRHGVRKTAKKLRYASEFFASLFGGKDARRRHKQFLKALERLQNKLGSLNDLAILPSVLQQIGMKDGLQTQPPLSKSEKADLIMAASEAHSDLLDVKRFWK